jgi:tol-pal system protein YbgF
LKIIFGSNEFWIEAMLKRNLFVAVLLMSVALPASAQDIATRIFQMEERMRALTGQIEELQFQVKSLEKQLGQKQGAVQTLDEQPIIAPKPQRKKLATVDDSGIEVIEDAPALKPKAKAAEIIGAESDSGAGVQDFTAGGNATVATEDGGFEGQVVTPPKAEQEVAIGEAPPAVVAAPEADGTTDQGIKTVSLEQEQSPDLLYKTANEALLRRQFPEAEAGFRDFLSKHPDHSLAGSAQYWLGETFYIQGDVQQAAKNFLEAYKTYPKSRRAPDSLLKLGMSLSKMGQKDQACAALNSVSTEFPRAVEAKKRASAEYKRAGC